jgi:hypothetical protein
MFGNVVGEYSYVNIKPKAAIKETDQFVEYHKKAFSRGRENVCVHVCARALANVRQCMTGCEGEGI